MAAPLGVTTLNLMGKFYMNKSLSDSTDEILKLQNVGWVKRKAINVASVTVYIKHHKAGDDVECMSIGQAITGDSSTQLEIRTLDWQPRSQSTRVFGDVIARTRRSRVEDIDEEFLKKDWTEDTMRDGVIETSVESNTIKSGITWTARQTWGFEMVNKKRRNTRHARMMGSKHGWVAFGYLFRKAKTREIHHWGLYQYIAMQPDCRG